MSSHQGIETAIASEMTARGWLMLLLAWMVALISTLSVLFIGEVMGQAPCVLCWYQRAFMFPLAVVLGVACFRSDPDIWRYGLPLAVIGGAFAAYHTLLVAGVIPQPLVPCGEGISCTSEDMMIFRVVPIPLLSTGAFAAIIVLLLLARERPRS